MLKILEEEAAIRKFRRQFIGSFKPFIDAKIRTNLGHPGGASLANVFWSDRLGIWVFHEKAFGNRCGHAFGVEKPAKTSSVPITCEINFPLHGIDRRMGGALAKDRDGQVFLVHRGKIGGGKKGVGKAFFEKYYRGAWAVMDDGNSETVVALVGALHSPRLARQVAQFVRKIGRIKELVLPSSPQGELTFDDHSFREEIVGAGYDQTDGTDVSCDHGLVVADLYAALSRKGLKVGNDAVHDLFIVNTVGKITSVYQVMTNHSKPALHAGMSRLLLGSVDLPAKPRLLLAVPAGIDHDLSSKLKKLGIDILEYRWQAEYAVFPGIHEFI